MLVFLVLWASTVSFKNLLILFYLSGVCQVCALRGQSTGSHGARLTGSCEHWGPLEKQNMLSTNESSLQPTSSAP